MNKILSGETLRSKHAHIVLYLYNTYVMVLIHNVALHMRTIDQRDAIAR